MICFDSFERLYRTLRLRRDLAEIFLEYSTKDARFQDGRPRITLVDFWRFLQTCQDTDWTPRQARDCYEKFTLDSEHYGMDLDHFSALYVFIDQLIFRSMLSASNSISGKTSQDLNLPLDRYFICSVSFGHLVDPIERTRALRHGSRFIQGRTMTF